MTNRIALYLAAIVIGLIALDLLLFQADNLLIMGKKLMGLIEWMAFWR